jgi:anti-anti-sigma factor
MAEQPTSSDLIASVQEETGNLIIAIKGEIDLQSSPDLRVAMLGLLKKHNPKKLILNLSRVPYMDSSAIAVLVEMLKQMNSRGGKICLTALQPRVKGLLEIVRLNTIFAILDSDQEAISK